MITSENIIFLTSFVIIKPNHLFIYSFRSCEKIHIEAVLSNYNSYSIFYMRKALISKSHDTIHASILQINTTLRSSSHQGAISFLATFSQAIELKKSYIYCDAILLCC